MNYYGKGTVFLIRQARTTVTFLLLGNESRLFQTDGDIGPGTLTTQGNQGIAEKEQTEKLSNRTRKCIRKCTVS